jgi:hypothetical protein
MTDAEYGEKIDMQALDLFNKMKNDIDIAEIVIRAMEMFFKQNTQEWLLFQDNLDQSDHNN